MKGDAIADEGQWPIWWMFLVCAVMFVVIAAAVGGGTGEFPFESVLLIVAFLITFVRTLVAWARHERGHGYLFYFWFLVTSPIWVIALGKLLR